ncbi:MAG: helix-turn-helix domain-containing protein [Sulfolobales archaeon]|nr:helix-turn-helix domain-containing protein [Ignisphaera sp.]MCX8199732.1 helix-turn-helix domain-containing protein [Sulfolobales archaeon]MDW8086113.1 helix-turn-helix domain-containing protein [Ignisphaera sp.]
MTPREKLSIILSALKDRIASPSDIIASTGLPRYEVLAAFHILEALNIITVVYVRGNYKLYRLSDLGVELLNALSNNRNFEIVLQYIGGDNPTNASSNEAQVLVSTA